VAGIEPTGRRGSRPTRFEDEGGHQAPFTSTAEATAGAGPPVASATPGDRVRPPDQGGTRVKKLLILVVLVAVGALVAKKVRESAV
jgi:hypothetical protein